MQVLESTDKLAPKSVLRHRPIVDEPETLSVPPWRTSTPRASRPPSQGKSRTRTTETHAPSRLEPKIQKKVISHQKKLLRLHKRLQSLPWMVLVGLTMTVTILLYMALSLAWSWGTDVYNNVHYGMPRTMQVDAFVGQESGKTPSHFIAENLRGQVLIIEIAGGNPQQTRIFVGPHLSGPGADRVPVTISFVDRNNNQHPDMLVQFGSTEIWYVNEHGTFVAQ